jgi:hypothetical protein
MMAMLCIVMADGRERYGRLMADIVSADGHDVLADGRDEWQVKWLMAVMNN